jgi:glycosyltransferase involved in cell wall biosynthesis
LEILFDCPTALIMVSNSEAQNLNYSGRLAVQQRVLPAYRRPFFEMLANSCADGMTFFAGQPRRVEAIPTADSLMGIDFKQTQNCHYRDPQSRLYLCWQTNIVSWLESQDPAALIVEANPRIISTRLAVHWMQRRGRPVLGYGLGLPRSGNPLDMAFRVPFLKSLDGLIAYSARGAVEYQAIGLQPVFVAYNAVAPRPTSPPSIRPNKVPGRHKILFVGRLQARKRLDILFKACAELPDDVQPEIVIVGDGPAEAEFQSLARIIFPRTEFVGARYGHELTPYFAAADLFVLPGTGGLAAQQAMTFGLPLIVAKGDGTQDDLVRPENGWQVSPGDQTALTTALQDALSDVDRLRAMGQESFRIVTEEINLEAMTTNFVNAINQV